MFERNWEQFKELRAVHFFIELVFYNNKMF